MRELIERLERIERTLILASKRALNVAEVAILLGVTPSRVRHLANAQELPYYKRSGKLYFSRDEIEDHMLSQKHRHQSKAEIESEATTRIVLRRLRGGRWASNK